MGTLSQGRKREQGMTKEEATIMCLKGHIKDLEETIKALRQEPILNKIVAEIKVLDFDIDFIYRGRLGDVVEIKHKIFREDVLKIIDKYKDEQSLGLKWISVNESLPKDRDWYLGIFKEPDTGWINTLPFVCDYVGHKTDHTTSDGWTLRGITDIDNPLNYYLNLECVAWMPLPVQYKTESEGKE